jgi:hypothetical protein
MQIRDLGSVMEKIRIWDQEFGIKKIWILDPRPGMGKIQIRDQVSR